MSNVRQLFAHMVLDAIWAYVIRSDRPSKIHRALFDGQTAQLRAGCGARARGHWRIVSAEYNEARECLTCRRVVAARTHGAPAPGARGGQAR